MRLIVGGSRGERGTVAKPYDITMEIDKNTDPHIFGDIGHAPFKDEMFDCVIFEYFPCTVLVRRELGYIRESYRLVKQGGKLVIITGAWGLIDILTIIEDSGFFIDRVNYNAGYKIQAVKICPRI